MKLLMIIALCLSIGVSHAQDITKTFKPPKNEYFTDHLDLGDNGFLLQTSFHAMYSKKRTTITKFNNNLEEEWSMNLGSIAQRSFQTPVSWTDPIMLTDEKAEIFYLVDVLFEGIKKRIEVIKFDISGKKLGEFVINKALKTLDGSIQHMIAIEGKLYFLSSSDYSYAQGRIEEKGRMSLFEVDVEKQDIRSMSLDLPKIKNDKKTSYWYLKGVHEKYFYLSSQRVDEKLDKPEYTYQLLKFSLEGKLVQHIKSISVDVSSSFIAPSRNFTFKNFVTSKDQDLNTVIRTSIIDNASSNMGRSNTYNSRRDIANVSSHSDIFIDEYTGDIYIYGLLYDRNDVKGDKASYNGYFIKSFDGTGKEKWSIEKPLEILYKDRGFLKKTTFLKKQINFSVEGDKVNLQLGFIDSALKIYNSKVFGTILTKSFSKEGQIIKESQHVFEEYAVYKAGKLFGLMSTEAKIDKSVYKSCLFSNPNANIPYVDTEDFIYKVKGYVNPTKEGEIVIREGDKNTLQLEFFKRKDT